MSETEYTGTKRDAVLTDAEMKSLLKGDSIYLRMGRWDDGTPAFIRVSPPQPNPFKQEKE